MTDEKPIPDAVTVTRCHPCGSERRSVGDAEDEGDKCTNAPWLNLSVEELEDVLHAAARSCRHCDEVWPNLYLGDM